jgi:hypothetical protein
MRERRDWQIVGIGYLTELNLSPIHAPETARKFLSRSAAAIAKEIHGVVFDPQADQVTLPSGIKRFARPGASESASAVRRARYIARGPARLHCDGRVFSDDISGDALG